MFFFFFCNRIRGRRCRSSPRPPSSQGTSALADYFPSCWEPDQGRSEKWGIFQQANGKCAHTGEQRSESRVNPRFTVKFDPEYLDKKKKKESTKARGQKVGKEADGVQVVVCVFFFFVIVFFFLCWSVCYLKTINMGKEKKKCLRYCCS